jgi:hypothetical protein
MPAEPLLFDELTMPQRTALAGLAHHPGFEVLVSIMNRSCDIINSRLVKLDPEDPEYEKKLSRLHLQSRTVNEFCSNILKSIQFHELVAIRNQQVSEEEIRAAIKAAEPKIKPGNPLASAVGLSNKSPDGD